MGQLADRWLNAERALAIFLLITAGRERLEGVPATRLGELPTLIRTSFDSD